MIDMLISIPGPQFLMLFAGLSFFCILTAWWWANKTDQSDIDLPKSSKFYLLSVALLRGGQNEVIRTVVFDLWSRNMIRITGTGADITIERVPSVHPSTIGGPVHNAIYDFVIVPKKVSELFSDKQLRAVIEKHLDPISENLKRLSLLRNEDDCARALQAFIAAFIIIVGTGGTKMAMGIMRGRPVGFLLILLIISVIVLFIAVKPGMTRPTGLGQRYLKSLKKEFEELKSGIGKNMLPADTSLAFAFAVFGTGILAGADQFKPFSEAFARGTGSSGGCGSGCSGGCGGGGGCGGCGGGD